MRISLFILGVFAAPLRHRTILGVPITTWAPVPPIVGSQHLNNVWPPLAGLAETVGPILRTSRCQDHIRRLSTPGVIPIEELL